MAPSSPVQISHKKMADKGGHIDFMFLGPPYPAAGSDAGHPGFSQGRHIAGVPLDPQILYSIIYANRKFY